MAIYIFINFLYTNLFIFTKQSIFSLAIIDCFVIDVGYLSNMDKKYENIIVQIFDTGISRIIINDPKTYNSLSFNTIKSLIKSFKKLNDDNITKVIIIEGSGKGNSANHNLKEIAHLKKKSKYKKLFNLCSELMIKIIEGRKPVIAKVHGAAFAAGCQLSGKLRFGNKF